MYKERCTYTNGWKSFHQTPTLPEISSLALWSTNKQREKKKSWFSGKLQMVIEGFGKRSIKGGQENGHYSAWRLKVDLRQFNSNL